MVYEMYFMSYMFAPVLTDVFNHWFAGSITIGGITLKKGYKHIWEELDDYMPINRQNTELKILFGILANHLWVVISDLIERKRNYNEREHRSRTICT